MLKTCNCSLNVTGTYEAVAEVCMALSEKLDVTVCYAPTTAFNTRVINERTVIARSDFHVWDTSGAASFISAPVRFPNNFKEKWNSPRDAVAMENLETAGIHELVATHPGQPGRWKFIATFSTTSTAPLDMIQAMSERFPDVVVSVIFANSETSPWGAQAYRAGERVVGLAAEDLNQSVGFVFATGKTDPMDFHIALDSARSAHAETLLDAAAEESLATVSTRPIDEHMPQLRGWPRWGLFTHAAYDGGLAGLERAMAGAELTPQALAVELIYEASAARVLGIASWVDTVMFGRRLDVQPEPGKPLIPHNSLNGAVYVSSHRALLERIAEAGPSAPNALALLASLSAPSVRLLTGYHPVAFLAAAVGKSTIDFGVGADQCQKQVLGLNSILFRMTRSVTEIKDARDLNVPLNNSGQKMFDRHFGLQDKHRAGVVPYGPQMNPGYVFDVAQDKLLGSLLAVALEAPERAESFGPALAAGVPPGFLFRSAASHGIHTTHMSEANPARVVSTLLESFKGLYGSFKDFPHDLGDELAKLRPSLHLIYESAVNEEMMREAIREAVTSTEPTDTTPAPARRRNSGA